MSSRILLLRFLSLIFSRVVSHSSTMHVGALLGFLFLVTSSSAPAQEPLAETRLDVPVVSPVTLKAGDEFSRRFSAGDVTVRVLSRPFFGSSAKVSSAIEFGTGVVTFIREKSEGTIWVGGDTLTPAAVKVSLTDDGRSAALMDVLLKYDSAKEVVAVVVGDQSFVLPVGGPAAELDLNFVAGTEQPWTIDVVDVQRGGAAATPVDPGKTPPEVSPDVAAALKAADFEKSRAFFKDRDLPAGEKTLFASNHEKPDTVAWTVESAAKLIHMALVLRQDYDYPGALLLADRARALLGELEKRTVKPADNELGEAYAMAAYAAEELLRDPATARREYEKSLALHHSPRASEGLARVETYLEKLKPAVVSPVEVVR